MIDLHSHLLPGVDDGATSVDESLIMARMAVEQGVTIQACTPHMFPGVYNNSGPDVLQRVGRLQADIDAAAIPLRLVAGADVHIAPDLIDRLRSGEALTLNGSRYLLLETPHHVLPPRVEETFFTLMSAGYVPILTHPERMSWIEQRYDLIRFLARSGAWMQLTAGALVGDFGKRAAYWSEKMLDEGLFQIVASDAHGAERRPSRMAAAFAALEARVGSGEARQMALVRPSGILDDRPPPELVRPMAAPPGAADDGASLWGRVREMWGRL